MTSALELLVANPPSEYGGSRALNRLHYQKNWTLCLLLQLHLSGQDYLVVCDYHDDVLVFDDSNKPTHVHFYQIKTQATKRWTISGLLKQLKGKTGKLPSILGKLYRHVTAFKSSVGSLNIVSNLYFSATMASPPPADNRTKFTAVELHADEAALIRASLKAELSLANDPVIDAKLVFHVSDLSLQDHDAHARGKLNDFLNAKYPNRSSFPVRSLYRVISDEIANRIKEEKACAVVADLRSFKAIDRKFFESCVVNCILEADRTDPRKILQDIDAYLAREGVMFGLVLAIRRASEQYALERLDSSQRELRRCAAEAHKFIKTVMPNYKGTFLTMLQQGVTHLRTVKVGTQLDDHYLMALIAWEILADGWRTSAVDTESEGGRS